MSRRHRLYKIFGTASFEVPVGTIFLAFSVHTVDAGTPILLSIDDIDICLGIYLSNLKHVLVHPQFEFGGKVARLRGQPFHR